MTHREIPRRPLTSMSPPAGGLEDVRREAGRRRRRRAVLSAAGGATAAAAAAVAFFLAAEGNGLAVLKPMPPAGGPTPTVSTSLLPAPAASRPASAPTLPTGSADTHRTTKQNGAGQPAAVPQGRSSSASHSQPSRPPSIRLRVYLTHGTMSGTQVCAGDLSSGQASVGNGLGWCEAASAKKVAGGERLRFTACRDDTRGGTLSYASRREVDFAVRQNGTTIWDWARDHPDSPGAHTRHAAAKDCWNWQLIWPDVQQSGASAGHGQFTFVATPAASELSGYPATSIPFRY